MLTHTGRSKHYKQISIIGVVTLPKKGTYHIFLDVETGKYGISEKTELDCCEHETLEKLFESKGL